MFCGKCGAKNDDGAKFCSCCGESIQIGGTKKAASKPNHRLIGIIAVVLVAAIVLVSGIGLSGGRSAEETAEQAIAALEALDLTMLYELYPEQIQEWLIESNVNTSTEEEYKQLLREKNEELQTELSVYGTEVAWSGGDLYAISKEAKESVDEWYKNKGISISAAKVLPVKMTINLWGIENSSDYGVVLIKYKGSWYVDEYSIYSMFY